jgi:hypothetical protein
MHILHVLGLTQLASTSPTCSNCHPGISDRLIYLFPRRGGGSAGARGSSGGASSSGVGSSSSGAKGGSSAVLVNGSSGGKGSSLSGGTGSRSDQMGSGSSGSGWIADLLLLEEITDNGVKALTPVRTIWVTGLVAGTVVLGGFGV